MQATHRYTRRTKTTDSSGEISLRRGRQNSNEIKQILITNEISKPKSMEKRKEEGKVHIRHSGSLPVQLNKITKAARKKAR